MAREIIGWFNFTSADLEWPIIQTPTPHHGNGRKERKGINNNGPQFANDILLYINQRKVRSCSCLVHFLLFFGVNDDGSNINRICLKSSVFSVFSLLISNTGLPQFGTTYSSVFLCIFQLRIKERILPIYKFTFSDTVISQNMFSTVFASSHYLSSYPPQESRQL